MEEGDVRPGRAVPADFRLPWNNWSLGDIDQVRQYVAIKASWAGLLAKLGDRFSRADLARHINAGIEIGRYPPTALERIGLEVFAARPHI